MAAVGSDEWRSAQQRTLAVQRLKDAISNCPAGLPQNLQNPGDTEKSIYEKSKSGEEYNSYLRNIILTIARFKNQSLPVPPAAGAMSQAARPVNPMIRPAPSYQQGGGGYPAMGQMAPQHRPMQQQPQQQQHPGMYSMGQPRPRFMAPGSAPPMMIQQAGYGQPLHMHPQARYPASQPVMQRHIRPMPPPPMAARMPAVGPPGGIQPHGYVPPPVEGVGVQSVTAIPNPSFSSRPPSVPPYTSTQAAAAPPVQAPMQGGVPSPFSSIAPSPGPPPPSVPELPPATNPPTPRNPGSQIASSPPATPLLPASPATSIGSPAQQSLMTPEDNETYVRKLAELQRYIPLLSKWLNRLRRDERKSDQYQKLKNLNSLLQDNNRRVPLTTLIKCGQALEKMFEQHQQRQPSPTAAATPEVPSTKLTDPSKSPSLLFFKMLPSPPPTCNNLMETIRDCPLPPERLPPAKRRCNRAEPALEPSLLRELQHLTGFKIEQVPATAEEATEDAVYLKCDIADDGLPEVPSLCVCILRSYPKVPPRCDLSHYTGRSAFLSEVGRALLERLAVAHTTLTLSALLTHWEACILRTLAKELNK